MLVARGREGELQVSILQGLIGLPEHIHQGRLQTQNAVPASEVFDHLAGKTQTLGSLIYTGGILNPGGYPRSIVISEIAADAGQRVHHRDTVLTQPLGRSDTRELQQLGCVDSTTAENDFTSGGNSSAADIVPVLDTDGTALLEQDTCGMCASDHLQVLACHGGL